MTNKEHIVSVRLNKKSFEFLQKIQHHMEEVAQIDVPLGAVIRHIIDIHVVKRHEEDVKNNKIHAAELDHALADDPDHGKEQIRNFVKEYSEDNAQ